MYSSYGSGFASGSSGTTRYAGQPSTTRYAGQPSTYAAQPGTYSAQPSTYSAQPSTRSFGVTTSAQSFTAAPQAFSSRSAAPVTYSTPTAYSSPTAYSGYGTVSRSAAPVMYSAPSFATSTLPTSTYLPSTYVQAAAPAVVEYVEEVAVVEEVVAPVGNFKVCVVGGAGGIGQPLCLLMAMDPNVAELNVYDLTISMVPAAGVGADLSHINKRCKVNSFSFDKDDKAIDVAGECLTGCDLVLVPAGVPRKPGQDRKDLLNINCGIAKNIVEACARYCPNAVIGLIVNPVNSVVPAMCEMWKKTGLDPRKIAGVTTLDVVRAGKFVHNITGAPIEEINIPVVGGHAGVTILPLFSQDPAAATIPAEQIPELDKSVQDAGTVVVAAKAGKGSATLSMAFAGARFGSAVLRGLTGQPTTECAYVESGLFEGMPYFTSQVSLGPNGVEAVHDLGEISQYENERLQELFPTLLEEIQCGLDYAAENDFAQ